MARFCPCGAAAVASIGAAVSRAWGGPFGDIGQRVFNFRRGRRRVRLDQRLPRMVHCAPAPKEWFAGDEMRRRLFAAEVLPDRLADWVSARPGSEIGGKSCGIGPGQFDADWREIRRIAFEKMPDGEEERSDQGRVPENGGAESVARNFFFDPFDAQIRIGGQLRIFRRASRARNLQARTKLAPGRAPVHAEIQPRQPRVRRQFDFGRDKWLDGALGAGGSGYVA